MARGWPSGPTGRQSGPGATFEPFPPPVPLVPSLDLGSSTLPSSLLPHATAASAIKTTGTIPSLPSNLTSHRHPEQGAYRPPEGPRFIRPHAPAAGCAAACAKKKRPVRSRVPTVLPDAQSPVGRRGLEPLRLAALAPQASASANSATFPWGPREVINLAGRVKESCAAGDTSEHGEDLADLERLPHQLDGVVGEGHRKRVGIACDEDDGGVWMMHAEPRDRPRGVVLDG